MHIVAIPFSNSLFKHHFNQTPFSMCLSNLLFWKSFIIFITFDPLLFLRGHYITSQSIILFHTNSNLWRTIVMNKNLNYLPTPFQFFVSNIRFYFFWQSLLPILCHSCVPILFSPSPHPSSPNPLFFNLFPHQSIITYYPLSQLLLTITPVN